jgi:hypothetical protein
MDLGHSRTIGLETLDRSNRPKIGADIVARAQGVIDQGIPVHFLAESRARRWIGKLRSAHHVQIASDCAQIGLAENG